MHQLESSYWLTSMIKGLIAKIKHCCLIMALRGPQTIWTILTILSDDLGHYYGVLIKVFEYFVVLGLHTGYCTTDQMTWV
jgi:hypothetical protein